jgi:ADP-ribosyl-[dinitrogen reductase] hydrolase
MKENMNRNEALGMFVGGAIGDALGAPLEFCGPSAADAQLTEMVGGGAHNTAIGEWTDDTAMMMCIANAYTGHMNNFSPAAIARNFQDWANYGEFGTRDYVFDIGNTTRDALSRAKYDVKHPYAGSIAYMSDGNGSIMRLAPIIIANHNDVAQAIGQSVAIALMTHGTSRTVRYTSQLALELCLGNDKPNDVLMRLGEGKPDTSVMGCYVSAWESVLATSCFEDAVVHAVNKGGDADTVGAVAGMIAGRLYGYSSIPARWLAVLVQHDNIVDATKQLYKDGM